MEQRQLIGKRGESVPDAKLPDDYVRPTARGANQISDSAEPGTLSELDQRGLNHISVHEYLAFQTKVGSTIGHLVGSLFTIGGTFGLIASLSVTPFSEGVSLGSGLPWFLVASCILGLLAIFNSNKLRQMSKEEVF